MMAKSKILGFLWKHATAIAIMIAVLFVGVVGFFAYTYHVVTSKFDSARMWDLPSRIYSDSTPIVAGQRYPKSLLERKLRTLGYYGADGEVDRSGEYRYDGSDLEIFLQDFRYPDVEFHGMPVRISMSGDTVRTIRRTDTESEIRGIRLEPELITSIFDEVMEDRIPIPLDRVPQHLIDAIVATEDRTFFDHEGISLRGIARAAWADIRNRNLQSGGSTLTQQLIKNLYLTPERTFRRKAWEAVMAIILDARYTKPQILEAYVNEIYLGQHGAVQVVGVEQASQTFFGKRAINLTLPESATIAGVIRSPNYYNPLKHPERAVERRNVILDGMHAVGKIDEAQLARAKKAELVVNPYPRSVRSAPAFVGLVLSELRETYPRTQLTSEGFRIFTTLDAAMQREAEAALKAGLDQLEKDYPRIRNYGEAPEGAMVTIQPGTGYVKALVGGRESSASEFNRAVQARRQPGSLFKPFVYTAAMDPARGREALTAASILQDSAITVRTGTSEWKPQNYDNQFHGSVSVREALVMSYNIPAVRAAIDAGVGNVVKLAERIGVESRLEPYPSISLGSFEVTPLELAYAYSVFANQGVRAKPVTILSVVSREGEVLENRVVEMERVADAGVTWIMNGILQDVIDEGTGARVRRMGIRGPYAGKTGTTNDYRDAWFVGYTPRILSLVWVGYDDGRAMGLSGGTAAAPVWGRYMKVVGDLVADEDFSRPDNVVSREIDPSTGLLYTSWCPESREEYFVAGTQPVEVCPAHSYDGWDVWREDEDWRRRREEMEDNPLRRLLREIF